MSTKIVSQDSHKTQFDRSDPRRQFGFGRTKLPKKIVQGDAGFGEAVKMFGALNKCPPQMAAIIHQTQGTLSGPVSDTALSKVWGAEIKPFTWDDETPGFTQVSSTLWEGETLAPFVCYGIGVHLEVADQSLVAKGNYQVVAKGIAATALGSPDAMTLIDKGANGAFGATDQTSNIFPAMLRYGGSWQANMFWHFCRAFNFQWKTANNVSIIDNPMRSLAYTPGDSSGSAASSSEMDLIDIVNECNEYYQSTEIGSAGVFRKIDRIRTGALAAGDGATGPTTAGVGSFSVSRAEQTVGVTYGSYGVGSALHRDLKNNSEYFKLDCPYVLGSGKQLGIQFRQVDNVQAAAFRKALGVSNGTTGQTVPPYATDSTSNFTSTTGGSMWEQYLDGSGGKMQSTDEFTYVFKFGPAKVTVRLLGQELDEDTWATITDPDVRAALTAACGAQFPGFKP